MPGATPAVGSAPRHVLLVTIDTLRADALSSYGGVSKTPNLDALAELVPAEVRDQLGHHRFERDAVQRVLC